MMKKDFWTFFQRLFPFVGLIVIIVIFTIINQGNMWSATNLLTVISIMIPLCLGGSGMVFVAAQGSTDPVSYTHLRHVRHFVPGDR